MNAGQQPPNTIKLVNALEQLKKWIIGSHSMLLGKNLSGSD